MTLNQTRQLIDTNTFMNVLAWYNNDGGPTRGDIEPWYDDETGDIECPVCNGHNPQVCKSCDGRGVIDSSEVLP